MTLSPASTCTVAGHCVGISTRVGSCEIHHERMTTVAIPVKASRATRIARRAVTWAPHGRSAGLAMFAAPCRDRHTPVVASFDRALAIVATLSVEQRELRVRAFSLLAERHIV